MTADALATQIRILRGVDATGAGGSIDLGGKRQRAVLAILALGAPAPVSIDRIIAGVWGDEPPASAPGTLQSYVSRLRRALGARSIELSSAGYELRTDTARLDLTTCRAEVQAAELAYHAGETSDAVARLRGVLESWSATPLGDLVDAPFAAPALAVLSEERGRAVEMLYGWELEAGRGPELVAELEVAVADDPWREELWRQLIVALYRSDRLADAMRAYQRAHETLADIGLAPGTRLRETAHRVAGSDPSLLAGFARGDAVAPSPHPGNVSRRDDAFVGREPELVRLDELVGAGVVVTVLGPGGIGKTRLVEEFLQRANPLFRDGTWVVELAPVTGRHVKAALVDALSLSHLGSAELAAVAGALAGRELLVAFDNCEHLVDDVRACVDVLRSHAPDLAIVATSREPIGVDGEIELALAPLAVPDPASDPLDGLELDAMRLFETRAARHHTGFRVTTVNAAAVSGIVRHLDGLPLAIEMAASMVGLRTPQQIADSLDARFELVHPGSTAARHETLRSLLDWSYDLLSGEQQVLFARLSTFASGFDATSAAAVCSGDGADNDDLGDQLEALRLRSLINAGSGVPGRYAMFDTMRAYGHDLIAHLGETKRLRGRHLVFVRELVRELGPGLTGPEQAEVFARLRRERLEIQHALDWAESVGEHDAIVEIVVGLLPWWRIELMSEEGMRWALLALDHTDDPATVGRLASGAALLGHLGDRALSRRLVDDARSAAERLDDDPATRALVLATAGDALTLIGDSDQAEYLLTEARTYYRTAGDHRGIGYTGLRLFRVLATRAPDMTTAESAAEEFVEALGRSDDLHLLAYAHLARASMYRLHGRSREALNAARRARELSEALDLVYLDVELLEIEAQLSLTFGELDVAADAIAALRHLVDRRAWADLQFAAIGLQAELDLAEGEAATARQRLQTVVSDGAVRDRALSANLGSVAALAAALADAPFDLLAPDADELTDLWPWERIEVLYRFAAACELSGRSPVDHLRAALELCCDVDAPVWRVATAQLAAHVAHPATPSESDALATAAAAYARAIGALPRAWERGWRRTPDGVDARPLDVEAGARMSVEALTLLTQAEDAAVG